jgi:hypothetical protein
MSNTAKHIFEDKRVPKCNLGTRTEDNVPSLQSSSFGTQLSSKLCFDTPRQPGGTWSFLTPRLR